MTVIEGRLIGYGRLERSFASYNPPDHIFVFEAPASWTVHRVIIHDTAASVETIDTLTTVDALAELIRGDYYRHGWIELLDAIVEWDPVHPDLYRHWAATRFERDFDRSSMHSRDLALHVTADRAVIAGAGRLLSDWKDNAVTLMATQLDDDGYQVLQRDYDHNDNANTAIDEPIGTLTVARYGFATTALVRVDDAGEIYIRLPYPPGDPDLNHIDKLLTPHTDDDF